MDLSKYSRCLIGNYGAPPVAFDRGEGTRIWDTEGNEYLDFSSGIAVNCLGHSHPKWVSAVQKQASKLVHCTNLFAIPEQARLAERLTAKAGTGRMLFCNSGAEANEALIKLARLYGRSKAGGQEGKVVKIVATEGDFHGRTYGAMSATSGSKVRSGFAPLAPGFAFAKFNELASFQALLDEDTAAVLIEPIQGEGGIRETKDNVLRGIGQLCHERGILLMVDEVQSGMGRTGRFFSYEKAGIKPDAISLAKGLGGGFPIGAIWVKESHADLFQPGSHGTTFGGSPLTCAAAHAVLDVIEEEELIEKVALQGASFKADLETLSAKYPDLVQEIRGRGYFLAMSMKVPCGDFVTALREGGLIVVPAGGDSVRMLPPLNATKGDISEALGIIAKTLSTFPTVPKQ